MTVSDMSFGYIVMEWWYGLAGMFTVPCSTSEMLRSGASRNWDILVVYAKALGHKLYMKKTSSSLSGNTSIEVRNHILPLVARGTINQ